MGVGTVISWIQSSSSINSCIFFFLLSLAMDRAFACIATLVLYYYGKCALYKPFIAT